MAEISRFTWILAFGLIVLLAGCNGTGTGSTYTPSGCGDNFCGTGETTVNCPLDCKDGGATVTKPSTGKYDAPELSLEIDDIGLPEKLEYGDQAFVLIRVKNKAKQSMNEEENQRLTIRNVKVLIYDFGDFIGCTPAQFEYPTLRPEEEYEISCTVTAPNKELKQTLRVRAFYTYDLYASLDKIEVFSKEEYQREKPTGTVVDTKVSGPMSMTISASKIPVQSSRPVSISVDLAVDIGKEGGVLKKSDLGVEYNVELLQVKVPEEFTITSSGQFTQTGNTLTASKIKFGYDNTRSFKVSLTAPDILTPRETFSLSAVATGFDIFLDTSVDLQVVSPE